MSKAWYVFIGGSDVTSQSNYLRATLKHNCLCGTEICAIYLPNTGFYPAQPFSETMKAYISDALVTGKIQPSLPYDAKKYVYLK